MFKLEGNIIKMSLPNFEISETYKFTLYQNIQKPEKYNLNISFVENQSPIK